MSSDKSNDVSAAWKTSLVFADWRGIVELKKEKKTCIKSAPGIVHSWVLT